MIKKIIIKSEENIPAHRAIVLWAFLCLLVGCTKTPEPPESESNAHIDHLTIDTVETYINLRTSDLLGSPNGVRAVDDGVFFSDWGFDCITKLDHTGKKLLRFGKHGKGPGEFLSPARFWIFDDSYMVYDHNGFKFIQYNRDGEFISEKIIKKNPVNPGFPPAIPVTVHARSSDTLLIPSGGKRGSLFAIFDMNTDSLTYVGEAVGPHVGVFNSEEVDRAYKEGTIPDIFLNVVLLSSDEKNIYAIQQNTGMLQKYTSDGTLLWQKDIRIPEQENLFREAARHNRSYNPRKEAPKIYAYADAMDARKQGVAVLLNMPSHQPVTVAWIPANGKRMNVISYPDIPSDALGFQYSFSILPEQDLIYFVNRQDGIIYKAHWPL